MTIEIPIFIALAIEMIKVGETFGAADIRASHTATAKIGHAHKITRAEFVALRKRGCFVRVNHPAVCLIGTV